MCATLHGLGLNRQALDATGKLPWLEGTLVGTPSVVTNRLSQKDSLGRSRRVRESSMGYRSATLCQATQQAKATIRSTALSLQGAESWGHLKADSFQTLRVSVQGGCRVGISWRWVTPSPHIRRGNCTYSDVVK